MKRQFPLKNPNLYGPDSSHQIITKWAISPDDILYKAKLPEDMTYFRPNFHWSYWNKCESPLVKLANLLGEEDPDQGIVQRYMENVIISPMVYDVISRYDFFWTCYIDRPYLADCDLDTKVRNNAGYCLVAPEASESPCITDDYVYYVTNKKIIRNVP